MRLSSLNVFVDIVVVVVMVVAVVVFVVVFVVVVVDQRHHAPRLVRLHSLIKKKLCAKKVAKSLGINDIHTPVESFPFRHL